MNDQIDGWMDEWMDRWINELRLCSACLPASSSVASATQFFSSRSCYNESSNVHLQCRLAGAWQHCRGFTVRSRANVLCEIRLQTRKAGASQQINQNSRSVADFSEQASCFKDLLAKSMSHILSLQSVRAAAL